MKRFLSFAFLAAAFFGPAPFVAAEKLPYAESKITPPTPEYSAKVESAAPAKPTASAPKRKLLVFSLHTGYNHEVIPHVDRVFEILGKKSGAFDTAITYDIEQLAADKLAGFDVLVLNNNCSVNPRRNLFLDVLEKDAKYSSLDAAQRQAKADALEKSILDFVKNGKGLVCIHGGLTMLNSSKQFADMIGAAFDFHPANQSVTVRPVESDHPLLAAFRDSGPLVHRDEPYAFKGPYSEHNFHPLLQIDTSAMKNPGKLADTVRYIAWIKPYGKGRVFYCSPGHFPETYQSPTVLRFILDGVQYAAGDLKCDDAKR
jgi:type 1 glutamine amidotransferase